MRIRQCGDPYVRSVICKHYDELASLPPRARSAALFDMLLKELPLYLDPEDRIFGFFGSEKAPEAGEKDFPPIEPPTPEDLERAALLKAFHVRNNDARSHVCVDYGRVLTEGLRGYEARILRGVQARPENAVLRSMLDCIHSVRAFSARLADYTRDALRCADESDRARLTAILEAVERVPYEPAEDFLQAVQSVWIIHFLVPLAENAWYSVSLGRFDRYLLPYYEKALADGRSEAELKEILRNFWLLLNSYCDGACALNVGGEAEDGPEYNALSRLIIECQKDFDMPAPILTARVSQDTPEDVMDLLIDSRLFLRGQPTFYFEESCRAAMLARGIPEAKAKKFSLNSCMGISVAGEEVNSMWGCVFQTPAILELALNGGALLDGRARLDAGEPLPPVTDAESLWKSCERYASLLLDLSLREYEHKEAFYDANRPDPFLEILTEDCIGRAAARVEGANYHNVTVECFGLANTADGIAAIDELVFKKRKYPLSRLIEAVRGNFAGEETLRQELLSCPKYGQDGPGDAYAARLADMLARLIRSHDHENVFFLPSLHTLDANVPNGGAWGASFDGRGAGEPFAKNAGPANRVRTSSPTAVVLSAGRLPQCSFCGGQPVDVHFDAKTVDGSKTAVAALLKTYGTMGGLQLQVNALSSELIGKAIADPTAYEDLVVRIGGYSVRFNCLSEDSKREFFERFRREEGKA